MTREPLPQGSVIGILGGGQLGRMLAVAAAKLGFRAAIYSAEDEAPAAQVVEHAWRAAYSNADELRAFARQCQAVTFEFENVPRAALDIVSGETFVAPRAEAAEVAQNRLNERRFFQGLGVSVAPYVFVGSNSDLADAERFLSLHGKGILKRTTEGYDGRGQRRVRGAAELASSFEGLAGPCILEAEVPFAGEVSVIAVRGSSGETAFYDMPLNVHDNGILRTSVVPSSYPGLEEEGRTIAQKAADALDYVGVLAIEFFVVANEGRLGLMVNEMAPRVHNSGHWTLDACVVSQFENHIRAVAGWPLGSTARHSNARMTNLLGPDVYQWQTFASDAKAASLTIYGKRDARPGRKVGHITEIFPLSQHDSSGLPSKP
jgi:5-(carboxyamino)imidazole ribonucleotide synthase